MSDVAQRAGVAQSSVSRVINGGAVSPRVRAQVEQAMRELGYQRDYLASGLRGGRTGAIGFLVRDLHTPIFADITQGAERTLRQAGYSVLLANSGGDAEVGLTALRGLQQRRVDGLILSLESEGHGPTDELLATLRGPVVLLDRELPGVPGGVGPTGGAVAGSVVSDHASGVRAATDHLLALGHRRIGFVCGPDTVFPTRSRLLGFQRAHQDHGVPLDPDLVRLGRYTRSYAHDQTFALLQLPDPPTALVAAGTSVATGVLAALHTADVDVPGRLSLVACDDTDTLQLHRPAVNTVRRDACQLGSSAAELLLRMLLDRAQPSRIVLPTEYVVRESVSRPPR